MTYQRLQITPDLLDTPSLSPSIPKQVNTPLPGNDTETDVIKAIEELESRRLDITADYDDWIKIGFALASMGETGRPYYHRVSSIYPNYDYKECEKQFDTCLKNSNGNTNIASFFHACKEKGVDIAFPKEETQNKPTSPVQQTQSNAKSELVDYEILQQYRFIASKPVAKPDPTISIEGNIIATPGNIVTLVGQAKAGKSGIVAAISAGVLAKSGDIIDTLGFTVKRNSENKAFIHIDGEQSNYNHYLGMMKVLQRAGRKEEPEWFHSYNFKSIDVTQRINSLAMLFDVLDRKHQGIHMAIIDGGADFVLDTNDLKESNSVVQFFEKLATLHSCTIVMILHFNPGTEKGRGHFGSQLERKSESVIAVSKDEGSEISTIKGKLLRNSGAIPNIQFIYDVDKGHHVYYGTLNKVNKAEAKQAKYEEIAQAVLEDGKALTYTELYKEIMQAAGVKERSAKGYIKEMEERGIVKKVDETDNRLMLSKSVSAKVQ